MTYTREDLEEHWRPMVRVAHSVLHDRAEAEECAATAIVQVLERTSASVDNLEAFMVTVAKRRAVDRLRSLERARHRDQRLCAQLRVPVTDVAEDVVSRAEARWLDQEARSRLSEQSYRILQAVADGDDMKEVAAREQLTLSAAHSDLFRSRRLLRSVWARALAILGVLWGSMRRGAVTAPTVAAAATLVLLVPGVTPHRGPVSGDDGPGGTTGPVGAAYVEPVDVQPHSARATSPEKVEPTPGPDVRVTAPRETRRVVFDLHDSAGRTTVTKERHGTGPDAGPVGTILECVEMLSLDPHHLGC